MTETRRPILTAAGLALLCLCVCRPVLGDVLESTEKAQVEKSSGHQALKHRVSVDVRNQPVEAAVSALLHDSLVPICLIVADTVDLVSLTFSAIELETVLATLIAQAPAYRFEAIGQCIFLYPKDATFDESFSVDIDKSDRVTVADQYVETLHRFPELRELWAIGIRGNLRAPIFTELVSIHGKGRIVDHLQQMLGDNPTAVVSIKRESAGHKFMELGTVRAKNK